MQCHKKSLELEPKAGCLALFDSEVNSSEIQWAGDSGSAQGTSPEQLLSRAVWVDGVRHWLWLHLLHAP